MGLSKSVCSLHCYTSHQGCLCVLALLVPERRRRCPPPPSGPSQTNMALFRVGKTLSRRLWRSTQVHRRVYCWLRAPGVKQQTPLSKPSRLHNPHANQHITSSRRQLFFISSTQFCCLNLIMTVWERSKLRYALTPQDAAPRRTTEDTPVWQLCEKVALSLPQRYTTWALAPPWSCVTGQNNFHFLDTSHSVG